NRDGPAVLDALPAPRSLAPERLAELLRSGAVVVDLRKRDRFAEGHLPGALNISWGADFTTWAGWLLPYDAPIHFVADGEEQARGAARDLAMIGIDRSEGFSDGEVLGWWMGNVGPLEHTRVVDWAGADRAVLEEDALLLDVRGLTEW